MSSPLATLLGFASILVALASVPVAGLAVLLLAGAVELAAQNRVE